MDGPLRCGLCRECCRGPRELELHEPSWAYRTYKKKGGAVFLATQPNGDCVYLCATGCSIYDSRPQACRDFDCRDHVEDSRLPGRMRVEAVRRMPIAAGAGSG